MSHPLDILLCQKFLPEHGGSIHWMHQAYRRWPHPVRVVTHDYYTVAPGTAAFPTVAEHPPSGDHVTDANLIMDRRDIFMNDWGIESPGRLVRYWRMNRAVKSHIRAAKRGQPIRVHCIHAVPEAVSVIPLKWRYGKRLKLICYAHGEEITACETSRQLRLLMRRAHKAIDLMIANSQNTVRLLANHIDPGKVQVVNPGVELSAFDGAAERGKRWRAENGLTDRLIVLTLARLDPRKNQEAVLRAVAALAGRFPALAYVIAGGGGLAGELRMQAEDLGVADRVVFTGEVDGDEKLALYGACDVFAMPAVRYGTDVEGFGMVFIEAGACGKPCVAGEIGGQPEAVAEGESGFVVDGKNQQAVTEALDKLLADGELRKRFGLCGRRRAESLDWAAVVRRTVELVDNL